jgi:hypothetical protein
MDGQVAGKRASALDGQSQYGRGPAEAVGHSGAALLLCSWRSYGGIDRAGPWDLPEAVEGYPVIGGTGPW